MSKHRKSVFVLIIAAVAVVFSSCSGGGSASLKPFVIYYTNENKPDVPLIDSRLLDVSGVSAEKTIGNTYKDSFPDGIVLKTPDGSVKVRKTVRDSELRDIPKSGICVYSTENGDVYRLDQKNRIVGFSCFDRCKLNPEPFIDGERLDGEQALEKAKGYISSFVGDSALEYLEIPSTEDFGMSYLYPSGKVLGCYRISFGNPVYEGYRWMANTEVFISSNGSVIEFQSCAYDMEKLEGIPDGFSEEVDSAIDSWMSSAGIGYSYRKGSIIQLGDGRLAVTGYVSPEKDGISYQSIGITVPIE